MLFFLARRYRPFAWCMAVLMYCDIFLRPAMAMAGAHPLPFAGKRQYLPEPLVSTAPAKTPAIKKEKPFTTGPTQPEMQQFSSVNSSNMVDLFTGDFSYSIPLLDVGGYPVTLGYQGGISMDQEASWCGLGWNINPGTINRNMRGLPDDFSGSDSIRKITSIRENKTIGVTGGFDVELFGLPNLKGGFSRGIFYNNYKGWGTEFGLNASLNSAIGSKGKLTSGLSLTNNSQEGITLSPSVSYAFTEKEESDKQWTSPSLSVASAYNSRSGIKALQLTAGIQQYKMDKDNQKQTHDAGTFHSSDISFASPSFTPTMTMPFSSTQFSFTAKVGFEVKGKNASVFLSGYVSKQRIAPKDTLLALPAYGYLYFQDGARNRAALLDFNREKEIPYREKPAVPHIAVPAYTYDAFSITGEGTGGMFRAYRGDIGFVYDHYIRSRDNSERASVDIGTGDMVHGGVDLNLNRAFTQNGPWLSNNPLQQVIDFKKSAGAYEAVYFRNPGEKSINSKAWYDVLGGDDVVTAGIKQAGISSMFIHSANELLIYRNKRKIGSTVLTPQNSLKKERDKRTQVISWLTAQEAEAGALSKYIDNYTANQFTSAICGKEDFDNLGTDRHGLPAQYFKTKDLTGEPLITHDDVISFDWGTNRKPHAFTNFPDDFSARWVGRIIAPVTGTYTFFNYSDDGARLFINDSTVINNWRAKGDLPADSGKVNLVGGEIYKLQLDYFDKKKHAKVRLVWRIPGKTDTATVPKSVLYYPGKDADTLNSLIKEKRINSFRKPNHISEVTVLNSDGRRYVYGLPVYSLKQKEATFNVNGKDSGDIQNGLVKYAHNKDNTTGNQNGKDWYYNSEEVPAYAHSFLLTGIVSHDYSDITGNGISDDDLGDAVKFNYSKICGITNPFTWRAPAFANQATYNEGLKTDTRDDKGSYVYGERELWYLHSIESKTMVATFVLENRDDLPVVDERGNKIYNNAARRLKEINLYSKADFMKNGTGARPVKTVHFEYTNELCPGANNNNVGKLTLKKVWFTYNKNNKGKQNPYVFNYSANNPGYNLKSYDRWGNYKNPLQNPGSTPGNVITNAEYPYALQDSALAAQNAAAWTLDSIHLPSGGAIKVQYESDDYAYVQNKRAMQLFKIVGLGTSAGTLANASPNLYTRGGDQLFVYIKVPRPVSSVQQVQQYYLQGIDKLYFKLFVAMPGDDYGNGSEYVSCYADLDAGNSYGLVDANTIWVKMAGISLKGDGGGSYSPLAKAAIQFLRLNLPSKAYPGSETGESVDLGEAVKILASQVTNITSMLESFDRDARDKSWAKHIDTSRSFIRLNNPYYKKYGGGLRVKNVTVYDNWNKMTNQRPAVYGQEYIYTTRKEIDGVMTTISSGVATWEPGLGNEENPFRLPIEYVEKIAPLGPVTLGYTEEPLGESLYPAPSVGYSCVRTRTINYKNKKSANGFDETKFYTANDFPVFTDRTVIDDDTKKRYKPGLANFLRINAKHHVTLSQGFKIELNDMHGKLRSKASYAETDSITPISYTENIYKYEQKDADAKRLVNSVMVMKPDGSIDSAALIGKDVELMMDMREQLSIANGNNINLNTDMFSVPWTPPVFLIPSLLNLAQREETIFRSAATMKVIQRYGILDSVIVLDKGSKISTKDILYDSETGDVLLSRTQNEFNDYVYNLTYPSHWAYDGMGLAYKNIGVTIDKVSIRNGKLTGISPDSVKKLFSSGDEVLAAGKQVTTDKPGCVDSIATFPNYVKIWAIDSSVLYGGPQAFYFIDRSGKPYNGEDIVLKVMRSGRRNMFGAVGSVTCLNNPLVKDGNGLYQLTVDGNSKIVAASAGEFKQFWKVEDILARNTTATCLPNWRPTGEVRCVQVSGVNTGYQEGQELDTNPMSSTYNTLRWVSLGFNCISCSKPAKWVNAGVGCEKDENGINTGYQEQRQVDTALCSASYGDTLRTRIGKNCAVCVQPAKWVNIGVVCEKDMNGNNTGYQQRLQRDTASCSPTYGDTLRTRLAKNCAACVQPAKWANVAVVCEKDSNGVNTGYQQQLQIDTALCSDTYGDTLRTRLAKNCAACVQPAKWVYLGAAVCDTVHGLLLRQRKDTATCSLTYNQVKTDTTRDCNVCHSAPKWALIDTVCQKINGVNTGKLLWHRRDTALCSVSYLQTRTDTTRDCITCKTPPNWQFTGYSYCEEDGAARSSVGVVRTGYKIYEERDMDSCSTTFGTYRTTYRVYDSTCICTTSNCSGDNKKCINGDCETSTMLVCEGNEGIDPASLKYKNRKHYEFSDGTWSPSFIVLEDFMCAGGTIED